MGGWATNISVEGRADEWLELLKGVTVRQKVPIHVHVFTSLQVSDKQFNKLDKNILRFLKLELIFSPRT